MKKIWLLFSLVIISYNSFAQAKIEIGEKHKIYSKVLKEEREYWISLPKNYNDTIYAPEKYSVVYYLDGERHFHSLTGVHQFLSTGPYAMLPEMIFVGVLTTKNRARDLTPTHVNKPQMGKAFNFPDSGKNSEFLKFIEKELMSAIENKYRTNGYKTLIGHSFGGLTVINTLLFQPQMFNSYIAIDPSIWWDNQYVLKQAKEKLKTENYRSKRFFLAQAYNKPSPKDTARWHEKSIEAFKEVLEKDTKSNLKWSYQFFKNDDHGTVSLPAEYYGLRYIFEGYQLPVKMVAKNPSIIKNNFDLLSEKLSFEIKPQEARIDWIAKYCIKSGNIKSGIELLKLNQEYYPNSVNTYKSLGTTYLNLENKTKAKQEFIKGLKIKPNDVFLLEKKM